ncbi:MAG TPA: TIGR03905 family TSCPD domain-containing protein [Candidatus Excrementavichristensenella intestinipullorum]|nr:TIGR03905 family TSCPD domain-containing protein [Candidatus Excrementavichristensenella intestinipullorum]
MMVRYKTHGTCSTEVRVEVEKGLVKRVEFVGGCNGNTQGVARLAQGRPVDEVIGLLKDVTCNGGPSCPMQLALALEQAKKLEEEKE